MRQIKVDAYEVPAGLAFHAHPGDTIVIVNGVCVGVLNGQAPKPLALPAPTKPKRLGKHVDTEADNQILEVLRSGPMDTSHILDALNLHPKDEARKHWGQRITRMTYRGALRVVKADKHKTRSRRYEIIP